MKGTGNLSAIIQGYQATVLNPAPMVWKLGEQGYLYEDKGYQELKQQVSQESPIVSMTDLE